MSKLAGAAPTMTPLTMCPGTLAYMPPEALEEPPRYTKKLDCFSEGVIMIQVCTRLWPEPDPLSADRGLSSSPSIGTKNYNMNLPAACHSQFLATTGAAYTMFNGERSISDSSSY